MSPIWRHLGTTGALVAILAIWGCEQGTEPASELLQVDQESSLLGGSLLGGDDGLLGDDLLGDGLTIEEVEALVPIDDALSSEALVDIAGLRSVRSEVGAAAKKLVSAVFGKDGGRLELGGHVLTVPAGAILAPTRFTMRLVPNGGVEVDLRAIQPVLGNIGSSGFEIPVQLALSYAEVEGEIDPEDLVIVRVGTGERLETTVVDGSRVQADLDHFSRYRVCSN